MANKDSNYKTSFIEIPKRISFTKLRREGVLSYDGDNLYPQRTELQIKGSATGKSVHHLYKIHINGEGFRDKILGASVVNGKSQTMNEILKKITKDFAYHQGFALQFNMDVMGQIHEINYIPFKWVRHASDDNKIHAGQMAIYEDWDLQKNTKFDAKSVTWIDHFDPDPIAIEEQIFKSGEDGKNGTVETWNGQIYYYTPEDGAYIESPFDCSMNDLETDQEIALWRNSTVLSSFLASYAAIFKQKFENPKESKEMDDNLMKVQGGRNAGKVIKIEGVGEDSEAVQFQKLDTIDTDGLFTDTENSTQKNIRKAVLAPGELVGEDFNSGFDQGRIGEQRKYYNSVVRFEREEVTDQIEKIIPHYFQTLPTDAEIIPLYEDELEEVTQEEEEETTTTTTEPTTTSSEPTESVIEESEDVQGLALNGAQISSLKDIILAVGSGELEKGPAKELIRAAFPALGEDQVNNMIDPIIEKPKTEEDGPPN